MKTEHKDKRLELRLTPAELELIDSAVALAKHYSGRKRSEFVRRAALDRARRQQTARLSGDSSRNSRSPWRYSHSGLSCGTGGVTWISRPWNTGSSAATQTRRLSDLSSRLYFGFLVPRRISGESTIQRKSRGSRRPRRTVGLGGNENGTSKRGKRWSGDTLREKCSSESGPQGKAAGGRAGSFRCEGREASQRVLALARAARRERDGQVPYRKASLGGTPSRVGAATRPRSCAQSTLPYMPQVVVCKPRSHDTRRAVSAAVSQRRGSDPEWLSVEKPASACAESGRKSSASLVGGSESFRGSLPQGAPTSPVVAGLLLVASDHRLHEEALRLGVRRGLVPKEAA